MKTPVKGHEQMKLISFLKLICKMDRIRFNYDEPYCLGSAVWHPNEAKLSCWKKNQIK